MPSDAEMSPEERASAVMEHVDAIAALLLVEPDKPRRAYCLWCRITMTDEALREHSGVCPQSPLVKRLAAREKDICRALKYLRRAVAVGVQLDQVHWAIEALEKPEVTDAG